MTWGVQSNLLTNIMPLLFKRSYVFWKSVTYGKFGVMNRPFCLLRQRNEPPSYDIYSYGFGTTLSVFLTTARFRMSEGKWLYLINSCDILKSSHYRWMQPWWYRLNTFLSEVRKNSGKVSRILLFQFFKCSWFSSVGFIFGSAPRKEMIWSEIGTSVRPFCWFSTSSSQSRKMNIKPPWNMQLKMWWCFVLSEVQFPHICHTDRW
jgi:hypothetical protein